MQPSPFLKKQSKHKSDILKNDLTFNNKNGGKKRKKIKRKERETYTQSHIGQSKQYENGTPEYSLPKKCIFPREEKT